MKKTKKSILLALPLMVVALAACNNSSTDSSSSSAAASSSAATDSSSASSSEVLDPVTVNMAVGYQPSGGATNMKFLAGYGALASADSYSAPDGRTYTAGEFKPAWRQLQINLNFTINDVTGTSASSVSRLFEAVQAADWKNQDTLVHILVGNGDQIVNAGNNGNIVDLASYLDQMPNFSAFLEENPAVKQIIMSDPTNNKGIYYAPYFDGYDDIEKTLLLRNDWVKMLLDDENPSFDTAKTMDNTYYTTFNGDSVNCTINVVDPTTSEKTTVTKNHTESIITTQNKLSTKNGKTLTEALRNYIDETYGGAYGSNRSQLFVGSKAAYDVDELVALYRCVLTNPALLTGDASKTLVPLFPRESGANRYADLWRMMQFFGVRGSESRNGYLYVDDEGKLQDARLSDDAISAVTKMHEMYQEGLILQNFGNKAATSGGSGKYNADLLKGDLGFSSYDYVQTQTVYNDDSTCKTLNNNNFEYVPTMPAVVDWDKNGNQYHYTESWRSVKTNGWCITTKAASDSAVLARCIKIFDYFFSDEGNTLMSYGPEAWIDGTIDYQGTTAPKLSDAALNELATLASGNYTNYYRYWIGGTFPIGYVKQQAMEYQCTNAKAQVYLNQINKCIELGTIKHVNHLTTNTDSMLNIVPATLAYLTPESNAVANMTAMSTVFGVESSSSYNIWATIVKEGWNSDNVKSFTDNGYDLSKDNYKTVVGDTLQVTQYLYYANLAYARMGMIPA